MLTAIQQQIVKAAKLPLILCWNKCEICSYKTSSHNTVQISHGVHIRVLEVKRHCPWAAEEGRQLIQHILWHQLHDEFLWPIASISINEGKKDMFYLTMHSTHFYLQLYGIRHMVKDHSDNERGNPLLPHGLLFPISNNGSFRCTIPRSTGWNEK